MIITIDDIVAKNPCDEYPLERMREIANGRESITLIDAFDLDIPPEDRIWLVTRFLDDRSNRLFAADVAERAVLLWPDDTRREMTLELIERVRDYAEGRITAGELWSYQYAYPAAAYSDGVAYYSAVNAAVNAALNAACAYAYATMAYSVAANAAAATDSEREWQLDRLRHYAKLA